ncbi:DUF5658 family protein [Paenibacillus sinopodophylli]|uniref:DUF5658 family protein n=1 Tax=Paenibacillus sinopodophylli TaxID=1837342 RepID=UPI00110CDB3A|nr:DUF5658 family protein [Paenibacillus sinopodophylli]
MRHMHLICEFIQIGGKFAIAAIQKWDMQAILIGLLLLCFTDAALTDIGLRFLLIEEMNPFVKHIYEWNITGYYTMKLVLPLLLLVIYYHMKNRKWINPCILVTVVLYFLVNVYHLVWISYGI